MHLRAQTPRNAATLRSLDGLAKLRVRLGLVVPTLVARMATSAAPPAVECLRRECLQDFKEIRLRVRMFSGF